MAASSSVREEHRPADVREIDPLREVRWDEFVRKRPAGSVFHTSPWLQALRRTYGYEPAALTTSDSQGNLVSAVVFCRISSWMTGRRIVSLPFSDHCEPLIGDEENLVPLVASLRQEARSTGCRYLELRPLSPLSHTVFGLRESQRFYLHRLDLRSCANEVFRRFHRDCIQRKIRRAERETLTITEGRTPNILAQFYSLVVRTRRRQGLPPPPFVWFQNLVDCLGTALTIRIASKNDQPIAGILTLEYNQSLVYKYGASDERFHNLGGMIYLFWIAIQDAISRGLTELDMGRSAIDNPGLVAFKDHWGASRSMLSYWRFPVTRPILTAAGSWTPGLLKRACSHIPDRFLISLGTRLYRHVG